MWHTWNCIECGRGEPNNTTISAFRKKMRTGLEFEWIVEFFTVGLFVNMDQQYECYTKYVFFPGWERTPRRSHMLHGAHLPRDCFPQSFRFFTFPFFYVHNIFSRKETITISQCNIRYYIRIWLWSTSATGRGGGGGGIYDVAYICR
jgi:hypothetical protein